MTAEDEFAAATVERSERLDAGRTDLRREAARAALRASGLPSGRKLETWKYTPISTFYRPELVADDARAPALEVRGPLTHAGVRLDRDDSRMGAPDAARLRFDRHPLAAVTAALAEESIVIEVADGAVVTVPFEASTHVAEGTRRCSRLTIRLGRKARAVLEERQKSTAASCQIVQVDLGPGATLEHRRIEAPSTVPCWSLVSVEVGADAVYRGTTYGIAAAPRRTDLHVVLAGDGARAELTGASAAAGADTFDLAVVVEHAGAHTTCTQRFHGIAGGRGTLTFNGRIEIHPGARGADAALTSRNLLLTPTARVNAKPELEINNRDVRCSHGATVGQLDPRQLFYLRSRGIDLHAARALLLRAFIAQCLTPEADAAGVGALFAEVLAEGSPP